MKICVIFYSEKGQKCLISIYGHTEIELNMQICLLETSKHPNTLDGMSKSLHCGTSWFCHLHLHLSGSSAIYLICYSLAFS